jgi:phosphomannomutase
VILDDGSWVCYRLSGTEPVVRAYTEARNEQDMEALKTVAEKFVVG